MISFWTFNHCAKAIGLDKLQATTWSSTRKSDIVYYTEAPSSQWGCEIKALKLAFGCQFASNPVNTKFPTPISEKLLTFGVNVQLPEPEEDKPDYAALAQQVFPDVERVRKSIEDAPLRHLPVKKGDRVLLVGNFNYSKICSKFGHTIVTMKECPLTVEDIRILGDGPNYTLRSDAEIVVTIVGCYEKFEVISHKIEAQSRDSAHI